ncbi:MAG: uroporphyrinogen-III synthase [Pseudomonadales bacterium]
MTQGVVWITRSRPGAERLAAHLEAAGYACLVAPVLEIVAVPLQEPLPGCIDVAVALSEHAVLHAPKDLWARARQVIAVGAQTAKVLASQGVSASHPPLASSEGLLAGPLRNIGSAGECVVLVSGRGGRTVLADGLRDAGAQVVSAAVYARQPVTQVPAGLAAVRAIVVSSGDGFEAAGQLWCAAAGAPEVPVFAPSARVAAMAADIGFDNAWDCGGADPDSVRKALKIALTTL